MLFRSEAVVAVRRQSASWAHAHVATGAVAGVAALAYMLYSEHPFSIAATLVDPVVVGGLIGLLSTQVLALKRWLTPRKARRAAVRTAARAAFYERGVRRTRARTGLLLYVSIVERMAEVVIDDALRAQLDAVFPPPRRSGWKRVIKRLLGRD